MVQLITLMILIFTALNPVMANGSVLDSGKTPQEIAAEILQGAKARYIKEQQKPKQVTMYSTSWCSYCRKARNYFKSKNIQFTEYNIERNHRAKREFDRLGGKAVPLIVVGQYTLRGFSPRRFEKLYAR